MTQPNGTDALADRRHFAGPFVLWFAGALALTPAIEVLKGLMILIVPDWHLPVGPRLSMALVIFAAVCGMLTRIGFSQRVQQKVLRRRADFGARVFLGLGQVFVVFFIYITAITMIRGGNKETLLPVYLVLSMPFVYGMLIYAFFFPGRYPATLAARYERNRVSGSG